MRWTGAGGLRACCAHYQIRYPAPRGFVDAHPFAVGLAAFGLLPFLIGYGLTATFLARRRRRILASLLG